MAQQITISLKPISDVFTDKEVYIKGETPISDAYTFTLTEATSTTIEVVYPDNGVVICQHGDNNIFDKSKPNTASVVYRLSDESGNTIWQRQFESVIENDEMMYLYIIGDNDYIQGLQQGTYTLQAFIVDLHIYLLDTTSDTITSQAIQAIDNTEYTTEQIQREASNPLLLQEQQIVINNADSSVDIIYEGYSDFICDAIHTEYADKICKLKDGTTQTAIVLLRIDDSDNNTIYEQRFYGEIIDDYTIRVNFSRSDEYTSWSDTIPLPQGTYNIKLYLEALNVTQECVIPIRRNTNVYMTSRRLQQTGQSSNSASFKQRIITLQEANDESIKPLTTDDVAYIQLVDANGKSIENTIAFSIADDFDEAEDSSNSITYSLGIDGEQNVAKFRVRDWKTGNILFELSGIPYIKQQDSKSITVAFTYDTTPQEVNLPTGQYAIGFEYDIAFTYSETFTRSGISTYNDLPCQLISLSDQFSFQESLPNDNQRQLTVVVRQPAIPTYSLSMTASGEIVNLFNTRAVPIVVVPEPTPQDCYLGAYIFGSYDGRQWALLGGKEKSGRFTDIGCKVEHTDVRFLRFALAGELKGNSRIDYMEISNTPSQLNTKIR